MLRRMTAVLIAMILIISTAMATGTGNRQEVFDELIISAFRARKIVGGAVVICRNGEVLYSGAYGYRNGRKTLPVTTDTCFRIASVTKMVTAIGLVRIMEERTISYDTDIGDILGTTIRNPAFPDNPITVRQILTHTSGIKPGNWYHPKWEELRKENHFFNAKTAPGTRYEYANLNGGIIGSLIEALTGQSLNSWMTEHLFAPLGINAAYHPGLLTDQSNISVRLTKQGTLAYAVEKALASLPEYNDVCDPAANMDISVGGLYISANGLSRILNMLIGDGELEGTRILPQGITDMMIRNQNYDGSSVQTDGPYVLGFEAVSGMPGGTWYGHQGKYDGLCADAYFQPDTGLTVVVIANGYNPQNIDGIASVAREFMEFASAE